MILIVLAGGLVFLYLNIKLLIKINFTFYFICLNFHMIIFRKKHEYERKISFNFAKRIIDICRAEPLLRDKAKNRMKYVKYIRKGFKIFYIKDIFFYPECIMEKHSFALEFVIVNRMLKRSLLNG